MVKARVSGGIVQYTHWSGLQTIHIYILLRLLASEGENAVTMMIDFIVASTGTLGRRQDSLGRGHSNFRCEPLRRYLFID